MARVLLKARPTATQMADRLAPPTPPGLELYLGAEDIRDTSSMEHLARELAGMKPDPSFVYVVEGPVRSLDGSFFDLSSNTESNREVVKRIAWLARTVAAEAILVHAIAPMPIDSPMTPEARGARLAACHPFVEYYANEAFRNGLVPLLENIPPVARQRGGLFMATLVGMSASDLAHFAGEFRGLKSVVDLSHAQLFINALRTDPAAAEPALQPLLSYLSTLDDEPNIESYLDAVQSSLFEVHVSNARGVLGEGLPYGEGDLDLDSVAARLARSVRYFVTETLEPDPDSGVHMREVQSRLEAVLKVEAAS